MHSLIEYFGILNLKGSLAVPEVVRGRWQTLEAIRVFALLWIVAVHVAEQLFPGWDIANPSNGWPPLAERITQLAPSGGHGIWDIPAWLLVNFALAGDQAVALFIILSGFGLTWSLSKKPAGWAGFLRRRLARIYPEYWMAHLFVLAGSFVFKEPLQSDASFLFSLLGIRVTPDLLYAVSAPWWYIGLIIQLYLLFPLLWLMLQRLGWQRFLLVTLAVSLAIRTLGLWIFADVVPQWGYLDAWSRGAIFITRVPEFVLGMALAAAARQSSPERIAACCRAPGTLILAAAAWASGMVASAFLLGNGVALVLLGAGAFALLFALLHATVVRSALATRGVHFLSKHSYAIFLIHCPIIVVLIPHGTPVGPRLLLPAAAAFAATLAAALLLDFATGRARRLVAAAGRLSRGGKWRLAGAIATVWALLVGAELWVRHQHPQEVNGWGERPALQEDPLFGWRMIPDRTTRLRWQGYDYTVASNALGFPAPLYPAEQPPGTLRIMTLGDAFTSAEGIDTAAAWPRLLERHLAAQDRGRLVQVQNFAVTGYGPNQYVAVARAFLPQFRPDVLLVTMFVNEFDDAQKTDRQFRQSIGFGRTPADSVYAVLTLGHLSAWLQNNLRHIVSQLRRAPPPMDAAHSQLKAFTASGGPADPESQERVRHRLAELKSLAEENGARLILLLVPANIQVCSPDEVYGAASHLDLSGRRLDLEQPQRVFAAEADTLGIEAIDLRPALHGAPCPYQRNNMHWTAGGHQRVAAFAARLLDSRAHPAALDEAALPGSPVPR